MELSSQEKRLIEKVRTLQSDLPLDQFFVLHLIPLETMGEYILQATPMKPAPLHKLRASLQKVVDDMAGTDPSVFLIDYNNGVLQFYKNR